MSHDFDDFVPLIMPYAKAAPELAIYDCLRNVATTFCERTRVWRDSDTIKTSGRFAEPIDIPVDAVIHEVLHCALDKKRLDPISLDDLARFRPTWRADDVNCGGAEWYVCPEQGAVQAVPLSSGCLTVEFTLKPSADATTLPDILFDLYRQTIAYGAAGMVLLRPNEAYGNPTLGAGLLSYFQADLDRLANAGRRGQQRAPAHSRSRFF